MVMVIYYSESFHLLLVLDSWMLTIEFMMLERQTPLGARRPLLYDTVMPDFVGSPLNQALCETHRVPLGASHRSRRCVDILGGAEV